MARDLWSNGLLAAVLWFPIEMFRWNVSFPETAQRAVSM